MADGYDGITRMSVMAPASRTGDETSSSVDARDMYGQMAAVLHAGAGGPGETLDVKLQDSPDNVAFTDIADGAFPQIATASAIHAIPIETRAIEQYVRAVSVNTGTFIFSVELVGSKQTV